MKDDTDKPSIGKAGILIVDDEAAIREMIGFALATEGFEYREAADTDEALASIASHTPDLILLDWMLPGQSGIDLARRLSKEPASQRIPIIMLTARGAEGDRVEGLETGADDYVTKPFSPRELVARIKAVLRRTSPGASGEIIEIGSLCLDPASRRVSTAGKLLDLPPTEFKLLHFLMAHPERVYSRSQLIDLVWGNNVYVEERTVDVHIRRLRMALEPYGHDHLIQTVRGAGYRLSTQT